MKIYLASRYSRRQEMVAVARALEQLGHNVTSRWIYGGHDNVEDVKSALEDLGDLGLADCCVSFTEGANPPGRARGGRHVEFGVALQAGKRLIVVGPRENVFHHVPGVEVVATAAQLLTLLRRREVRSGAAG